MKENLTKVLVAAATVAFLGAMVGCSGGEEDHPSRMEESLKQQRGGMDQRGAMATGNVPGNPAATAAGGK